jgi:hypothetical protein
MIARNRGFRMDHKAADGIGGSFPRGQKGVTSPSVRSFGGSFSLGRTKMRKDKTGSDPFLTAPGSGRMRSTAQTRLVILEYRDASSAMRNSANIASTITGPAGMIE